MLLYLEDGGQAIHRVPCETADRLRDDKGIFHHFVKTTVFRCGNRADSFVCIYKNKPPILSPFYVVGVIISISII